MVEIRHKATGEVLCRVAPRDRAPTLRGADLRHANLAQAALQHVDLTGANLREANLRGANLSCADLTRADLTRADLRDAILEGALMFGANLSGANLRGSELTETGIDRALMRGAFFDRATRWPMLFNPVAYGCIRRTAPSEVSPAAPPEGRGDEGIPAVIEAAERPPRPGE